MKHTVISFVFPVRTSQVDELEALLAEISQDPKGNSRLPLGRLTSVHYASLVVFPDRYPPKTEKGVPSRNLHQPYLVAEFNSDSDLKTLIDDIAKELAEGFDALFRNCQNYTVGTIRAYLQAHAIPPAAWHIGNVGVTVQRVLKEAELRRAAGEFLDNLPELPASAAEVRQKLMEWADENQPWVYLPEPRQTPVEKAAPYVTIGGYLGFAAALAALGVRFWKKTWLIIPAAGLLYWTLRRKEKTDAEQTWPADPNWVAVQEAQEDRIRQNHLASLIVVKPGPFRRLLLRIVLWATNLIARTQTGGQLGGMTTIHFAHWALVERGNLLLFFSNYDNSWGSYLDDFTDKANPGLSSIWSNTELFPHTRLLVNEGAGNGVRFKAWARMHMTPTNVWYHAYEGLSVGNILQNSEFREGFQKRLAGEDLESWLQLLGGKPSATSRDLSYLSREEFPNLQGIVVSAYSNLTCADYVLLAIDDEDREKAEGLAHAWLKETAEKATYTYTGSHLDKSAPAINIALTREGLRAFGLTEEELASFSIPFQQGMNSERRRNILGDSGVNDPELWDWHGPKGEKSTSHILLMLFAKDPDQKRALYAAEAERWQAANLRRVHRLPGARSRHTREPFGFVDGIGQPVIKGSPLTGRQKARTGKETLVNAGEFVLGYINEDGVPAPGPMVAADRDPKKLLPEAKLLENGKVKPLPSHRDLGFNGTYLVFRQLSQDVEAFSEAMKQAAANARHQDPEFYAAKVVGRWKSGVPLVQSPHSDPNAGTDKISNANNFFYRPADPEEPQDGAGLRCPIGAHIRRANPRDTLGDAPEIALESAKRHRLLRRGRVYDPEIAGEASDHGDVGLQFICLGADIERQFEFVQQTWINNPNFAGLNGEVDPLIGQHPPGDGTMTIPDQPIREKICTLANFVTVKGGGYFFLPSKQALEFLASL